jgi:hypothetical protein
LWDDPVTRSLSIDGVVRDGIGEFPLRSLADLGSTTTGAGRSTRSGSTRKAQPSRSMDV